MKTKWIKNTAKIKEERNWKLRILQIMIKVAMVIKVLIVAIEILIKKVRKM